MLASRATAFFCSAYLFPPCVVNTKVLRFLKSRTMVTEKSGPNLTKSAALTYSRRKDKKMEECEFSGTESEARTVSGDRIHLTIQNLKDDPSRLEALSVKDLRVLMNDAGLPTKGSKKDIISAFRSFLNMNGHGEDVPSTVQALVKTPSKRKNEESSCSGDTFVEISDTKQRKTRGKARPDENGAAKERTSFDETEIVVKNKPLSSTEVPFMSESGSHDSVLNEPWTVLTHKKPQSGWVAYNPRVMRPPPLNSDTKYVKLVSWNVNGLRALLKSEGSSVLELAQREDFDVLCMQETKIQEKDVEKIKKCLIDGYENTFWTCSNAKLGYSGTAVISRIKPISVKYGLGILDHDGEGRIVTLEFDSFYLTCAYVPNSGDGLKRLAYRVNEWDPSLSSYLKDLEKSKPVILTGDLNCANEEMDIFNPAGNRRSAGFTDEERQSFKKNFLSKGFVDTFRRQHPSAVGYTYYGYRHGGRKTNKGWRLDYFLVSESIADKVNDSYILPDVPGSDHCPIGLILKL